MRLAWSYACHAHVRQLSTECDHHKSARLTCANKHKDSVATGLWHQDWNSALKRAKPLPS